MEERFNERRHQASRVALLIEEETFYLILLILFIFFNVK